MQYSVKSSQKSFPKGAISDHMSVITHTAENASQNSAIPSNKKRQYKHWTEEEEHKLVQMILRRGKGMSELTDIEWSDMAL